MEEITYSVYQKHLRWLLNHLTPTERFIALGMNPKRSKEEWLKVTPAQFCAEVRQALKAEAESQKRSVG